MNIITSIALLLNKYILPTIFILCSFFVYKNAFSSANWKREWINIVYKTDEKILGLGFVFTGFEIGANNEHGYIERCDFQYSTDGEKYKTLAKCEGENHAFSELFWVKMTNKSADAKIEFYECMIPQKGTLWKDLTNPWVAVQKRSFGAHWGFLILIWYVPDNVIIKKFRVTGKWTVNGLYCPDYFDEIYDLSKTSLNSALKSDVNTDSKEKDEKGQGNAKVSSKADAIVIQGVDRGEKIHIYTTAGVPVKSIVVNDELINIQLPAKQVYIVNVGHTRYKVAL